jgi:hypothetical protein
MGFEKFVVFRKEFDKKGGEKYIESLIEGSTYRDYIHSPMWHIISQFCRLVQPVCIKCKETFQLQVHHLSYEHFGCEMYHLEDVTVLCGKCHEIIHILEYTSKSVKEKLPEEWESLPSIQEIMDKGGIVLYEMVQT